MTATTKQQLRQGKASFSKRDREKGELHHLKELAAQLIGDRAGVYRDREGLLKLYIDRVLVVHSRSERKIEDKIREAGALVLKQKKLEGAK